MVQACWTRCGCVEKIIENICDAVLLPRSREDVEKPSNTATGKKFPFRSTAVGRA
jgi:hypothetical protein